MKAAAQWLRQWTQPADFGLNSDDMSHCWHHRIRAKIANLLHASDRKTTSGYI